VVFGSSVEYDWNLLRQREQHLVERLATVTELVYVERHGSSSKGPLHLIREVIRRVRPRRSPAALTAGADPQFLFLRTAVLPIQGIGPADRINAWLLARKLREVVSRPLEECCALVCNPSPYVLATLRHVRFEAVISDVAQRYAESPETFGRFAEHIDLAVATLADARTCDSATLVADRADQGLTCWQMPQGVDSSYRTRPRPAGSSNIALANGSGRPVVGFLGAISGVIDWAAVIAAARALEDVRFIMCGPTFAPVPKDLPCNIELRGWVAPEEVPRVIASFNVGLIPYVRNRRTDAVLPTKLTEYLAAGIRVVSSDLPDVVSLSRELGGDLIRVYDDHPALVEAIREMIGMESVSEGDRLAIYERYNWDCLVREWVAHVEGQVNCRVTHSHGEGRTRRRHAAGTVTATRRRT
jgi:glycosyltransferase involved in cell wall biosynthesis